jgi:hypothetical protein
MNRKRRLPKKTNNQVPKRYQAKIKMVKPKALRMLGSTKLMMGRSTQGTPLKGPMKEKGLKQALMVMTLKFCQPSPVSNTLLL